MCDEVVSFFFHIRQVLPPTKTLIISGGPCQLGLEVRFWREKNYSIFYSGKDRERILNIQCIRYARHCCNCFSYANSSYASALF